MYKAGDFTNGKMNEIFKEASRERSNSVRTSVDILHRQFGEFTLIGEEQLAVNSMCMLAALKGVTIKSIFSGIDDGTPESNELQKAECCTFLKKTYPTWGGIFIALVGICHAKIAFDAGVIINE